MININCNLKQINLCITIFLFFFFYFLFFIFLYLMSYTHVDNLWDLIWSLDMVKTRESKKNVKSILSIEHNFQLQLILHISFVPFFVFFISSYVWRAIKKWPYNGNKLIKYGKKMRIFSCITIFVLKIYFFCLSPHNF